MVCGDANFVEILFLLRLFSFFSEKGSEECSASTGACVCVCVAVVVVVVMRGRQNGVRGYFVPVRPVMHEFHRVAA